MRMRGDRTPREISTAQKKQEYRLKRNRCADLGLSTPTARSPRSPRFDIYTPGDNSDDSEERNTEHEELEQARPILYKHMKLLLSTTLDEKL